MRVLATSDIHLDYEENRDWLKNLSDADYTDDILLLGGDVSHDSELLKWCFETVREKFAQVFFVPGNHDLWIYKKDYPDSIEKFFALSEMALSFELQIEPRAYEGVSIVPLLSWYDYSFGKPSDELQRRWNDFRYCRWPNDYDNAKITDFFLEQNKPDLQHKDGARVITLSHFMPRLDLLPAFLRFRGYLYAPVLGSSKIDGVIREIGSHLHVYGHSHINVNKTKKSIRYINSAYGYPSEGDYTSKELALVYEG